MMFFAIAHCGYFFKGDSKVHASSSSKTLSEAEINSLIMQVKDILPELGEGFILVSEVTFF